ncbi:hypothetical protein SAMN05444411_11066 [Lutibacter oricola]|uniref:SpoIIAA-like n=1 Tax=Lutibacter oricola TaxID=762486 RepID=A0A1H3EYU9_9FLAO|nr:hypothetical protein [Lutibacter oricola]SDX83921.1 hypothetical protein SAMN05444411_11066 [Lutibacter oricola]
MYTIDYSYLNGVIRVKLTGNITVDEAVELTKEFNLKQKANKAYVLTDVRKAIYNWTAKDIEGLYSKLAKYYDKDRVTYEAVLIEDPEKFALTTLYHEERENENHISKIFYSEAVAIEWLLTFK